MKNTFTLKIIETYDKNYDIEPWYREKKINADDMATAFIKALSLATENFYSKDEDNNDTPSPDDSAEIAIAIQGGGFEWQSLEYEDEEYIDDVIKKMLRPTDDCVLIKVTNQYDNEQCVEYQLTKEE